jgi:hypothetical protein
MTCRHLRKSKGILSGRSMCHGLLVSRVFRSLVTSLLASEKWHMVLKPLPNTLSGDCCWPNGVMLAQRGVAVF